MNNLLGIILVVLLISLVRCKSEQGSSSIIIERNSWDTFFQEHELNGSFILSKLNCDTIQVYNPERSIKEYSPASTFKILNSLIALQTNVIKDEDEIIKWDGKKRFYEKWNEDQNLRSAIKYSCVWFYQELARRIGKEKMQHYLDAANYGNQKMGSDVDKFWLEGKLKISALGQLNFLNKFLNYDLPFSQQNFNIVKKIILNDSTEAYKLYAKTGWSARKDEPIGWYIGFVEKKSNTWIFAMNIDLEDKNKVKFRKTITYNILRNEGIIN